MSTTNIAELLEKYKNGFECKCGKRHELKTKTIVIKKDVCDELKRFITDESKNFYNNESKNHSDISIALICDRNTEKFADCIKTSFISCGDYGNCNIETITLDINSFHAEESMVVQAREKILQLQLQLKTGLSVPFLFSVYVAVGSGTIHDITRLVAYEFSAPFISFPTAPSVDGFISNVVPITKNGMKTTLTAVAPVAVFADVNIFCKSPQRLVKSGFGDLVGKYISLFDWKLSSLLTGEYYCSDLADVLLSSVNETKNLLLEGNENENEKFIQSLMEGLLISGMCMQLVGNSRPASAAEHHIAHLIEMEIILKCNNLHGENVGVGSVICAKIYHELAKKMGNLKFTQNSDIDNNLIEKYFGAISTSISNEIKKENKSNANGADTIVVMEMISEKIFNSHKEEICSELKAIPAEKDFTEWLQKINGISDISDLDVEFYRYPQEDITNLAVKLAPYIRQRLTLLKMMRLFEH